MANNWESWVFDPPFAEDILKASDKVSEGLAYFQGILDLVKGLLEIARAFTSLLVDNPIEALIGALLDEIDALLDALLNDTKIHAIFIPIQASPITADQLQGAAAVSALATLDFGEFSDLATTKNTASIGVNTQGSGQTTETAQVNDASTNPVLSALNIETFWQDQEGNIGGNAGFYRKLVESVHDPGDCNRPNFGPEFAVGGAAFVMGTADLKELYEIFGLFQALFALGARADLSGHSIASVKGLRATVLPINNINAISNANEEENILGLSELNTIGVLLEWDKLGPVLTYPALFEETQSVKEFYIIRSTDPTLRTRTHWNQVFDRFPSLVDDTDLPEAGDTKVIARIQNDALTATYVDADRDLRFGVQYYYAVVPRIALNSTFDFSSDENLPPGDLSNVVRVMFERPGDCKGGEPPDWIATPSIAKLFPVLESLINEVRLFLKWLRSLSLSENILDDIIDMIEKLILRIERAVALIDEINRRLAALLAARIGGIHCTKFAVPAGGMNAWNRELARRLNDRTDETRPAFDSNELVAGAVVVGGAPNFAALAALMALLDVFFGTGEDNPVLDALEEIDEAVGSAEVTVFGDDLQPDPTATADEPPQVVFDDGMRPVDSVDCD